MTQSVVSGSIKYTAETASRDVNELAMIGRFRLKDLAMSVGLGDSAEHRSALTSMKVEELAALVAQQLARLDAAAPAPVVAETPAAAPQEAPVQEAPRKTRTPRVAPPAQQAPASAPAAPATVDIGPVMEMLGHMVTQVQNLSEQLTHHVGVTNGAIERMVKQGDVNLSLSLILAEEVTKAGRADILSSAVQDLQQVNDLMGKALKGGQ